MAKPNGSSGRVAVAADVEAVMAAARVSVAVSAQSVAGVDDVVTLPQLRALVMIASRSVMNLGAVAQGLGVHPSNAARLVECLVVAGLVRMPASRRRALVPVLRSFADAGGETPDDAVWSLGWTTSG